MNTDKPWYKRKKVWKWIGITYLSLILLGVVGELISRISGGLDIEKQASVNAIIEDELAQKAEELDKRENELEKKEALVAKIIANEKAEAERKVTEEEVKQEVEKTKTLKRQDMDSIFSLDPEEKQYENAPLIFKDGDTVTVDYISYTGANGIDYVSALFFQDNLVNIQMDTKLSNDELEKILDIQITKDLTITDNRDRGVFEILLDHRFDESKIDRYPFELD